jgi:hypothetical protein
MKMYFIFKIKLIICRMMNESKCETDINIFKKYIKDELKNEDSVTQSLVVDPDKNSSVFSLKETYYHIRK